MNKEDEKDNFVFDWDSEDGIASEETPIEDTEETIEDIEKYFQDPVEEDSEDTEGVVDLDEKEKIETPKGEFKYDIDSLKSKGFLPEDFEGDNIEEGLESSLENKVEATVANIFKDMPKDIRDRVDFIVKGGNYQEYINQIENTPNSIEDFDIDDDIDLETITRMKLQEDGLSGEDIDDQIAFLKEKDKLKAIATPFYNKKVNESVAKKEALLEKQKAEKLANEEKYKKYKNAINTILENKEGLESFIAEDKNLKSLTGYMTDLYDTEDGKKLTKQQADLYNALKDPIKSVKLAYVLQKDFDFSFLTRAKETVRTQVNKSKKTNTKPLMEWLKED